MSLLDDDLQFVGAMSVDCPENPSKPYAFGITAASRVFEEGFWGRKVVVTP